MGRCRRLWLAPMHANWSICWGGPAWIFGNALLENCNSLMAAACWMPIFTTGKGKKSLWSPKLIRGFQEGLTPTRRTVFKDRKDVVEGKSVSERVDPGGGRIIKYNKSRRHKRAQS